MSLAEIFDFSVCKKILDVHPLHFDRVVHSGIRCRVGDDLSFLECNCKLCRSCLASKSCVWVSR